jgi:hypothetical protein
MSLHFALLHRLYQVFTSKRDINYYPSLLHYRNAANKRSSFSSTYMRSRLVFNTLLDELEPAPAVVTPILDRNRRPLREKTFNVTHQRIDNVEFDVPAPLATKTPARLSHKIFTGTAPSTYVTLDKNCKGPIMKQIDGSVQRCSYIDENGKKCNAKTQFYCHGCKQWLCFEKQTNKDMSSVKNFKIGVRPVKDKQLKFQICCFHLKHFERKVM